jgi:S1-C subfamily serine protease
MRRWRLRAWVASSFQGRSSGLGRRTLNRDIGETIIDDFVQTDAAIYRGYSGGPPLKASGEVVRINTAFDSTTER